MITKNNVEYRNLVEQVLKNKEDIAEHYNRDRVLEDYGIRIVGSVNSVDQLPNAATYNGSYGDAYTVGTGAPYDFYIFTRPLQGTTENRWLDLGQLAIQGPQGDIGPEGPAGPQGESTQWYVGQGVPYIEANTNSLYFDTTTANIYQKQEGQWVMVANIKGNTGAQGPQGPQGPQGEQGPQGIQGENGVPGDAVNIVGILTSALMLPDPDTVARDSAYVVQDGTGQWLYFITGLGTTESPLIWDKVPFENGTTVLVGGNPVQTFDADTKVQKWTGTTQHLRVYANYAGTEKNPIVATTPGLAVDASDRIAIYGPTGRSETATTNGHLMTGNPAYPYDATNKQYVDEQVQAAKDASVLRTTIANIIYGNDAGGNLTKYTVALEATANSIVRRDYYGRTAVASPINANQAANKGYVDDAIANRTHITEQFKIMADTSAGSDGILLSSYYAMDNIHLTIEAIPFQAGLQNAGMAFITSTNTEYRKLEFFKSTDVLGSGTWCKGTLVDGKVSYFQATTGHSKIFAKTGTVLVSLTVSPITAY